MCLLQKETSSRTTTAMAKQKASKNKKEVTCNGYDVSPQARMAITVAFEAFKSSLCFVDRTLKK
jgi:hypothetical protein